MAVTEITSENFDAVTGGAGAVLIDFWAEWCGPCKMLKPTIEEIAEEYADSVRVAAVDVDKEPDLAARFGVLSIPTLVVLRNGEVADKSVGVVTKDRIVEMFS